MKKNGKFKVTIIMTRANRRCSEMSVAPWDEYTQWDYKIAYRRFLDDMDAEICPWKCFEKLELKDALNLHQPSCDLVQSKPQPTVNYSCQMTIIIIRLEFTMLNLFKVHGTESSELCIFIYMFNLN